MDRRSGLSDREVEELTAVLSGEADERTVAVWDERLRTDPAARDEAAELQRAWDVLDILPSPRASEDFTRKTAELVNKELKTGEQAVLASGIREARPVPFAVATGLALAAASLFLVGYAIVLFWPHADDRIRGNRALLERLPLYQAAPDLQSLDRITPIREKNPWPRMTPTPPARREGP